jgi:hypothetical protein
MTTINRRRLRAKLGSRTVRRQGTKNDKDRAGKKVTTKARPATLVAEMVRAELAKQAV